MLLLKKSDNSVNKIQENFFNWKFDEIAKLSMVGVFLTFPIALGLANSLSALVLVCWILAGSYKKRYLVIKNNALSLPLILLYVWI